MRVLVTGGAGFIGSHLQNRLIEEGYKVAVVDNLRSGKKERLNPKAKFYQVDITDKSALDKVLADFNPQVVFHLAAQIDVGYSTKNPFEDFKINVLGTLNLLEGIKKLKIKKIIYSNTAGVYGNVSEKQLPVKEDMIPSPISPYGISKLAAENYIRFYANLYGFEWISLRYSNVYGPGQLGNRETGVVSIFIDELLHNQQPTINGEGFNTRDYIYVTDVVSANLKATLFKGSGIFNISTQKETTNNEVFNRIALYLKSNLKPKHGSPRLGDILRSYLSSNRANRILKWKCEVSFKDGIEKTIEYYKYLLKL
jgi:UDP-glucose 4-epimerase